MPVINPEIQRVLQAAGVGRPQLDPTSPNGTIKDQLDQNGLDITTMLGELSNIIMQSGSEVVKISAIEKVLKMHGALKENQAPPPVPINIIINDPGKPEGLNPILMPRGVVLDTTDKVQ